jgi:hypothetical protein
MPACSPFASRRTPLAGESIVTATSNVIVYQVAPDGIFDTHFTSMRLSAL